MRIQIRLVRPAVALPHHLRVTSEGRGAGSASPVLAGDNYCVDRRTPFCFSPLLLPHSRPRSGVVNTDRSLALCCFLDTRSVYSCFLVV